MDVRAKIVILIITCLASAVCRSLQSGAVVFTFVIVLTFVIGRQRLAFDYLIVYAAIFALLGVSVLIPEWIGTRLGTIVLFGRTAVPVLLAATIVVTTTKIGDLMAGLYSWRVPRMFVIPFAVGLRFFPTLRQEAAGVRDSMRLRGMSLTPKNLFTKPVALFEALLVPLMLRSAKIADELAAAAAVRGIDRPGGRTSFNELKLRRRDWMVILGYGTPCVVLSVAYAASGAAVLW